MLPHQWIHSGFTRMHHTQHSSFLAGAKPKGREGVNGTRQDWRRSGRNPKVRRGQDPLAPNKALDLGPFELALLPQVQNLEWGILMGRASVQHLCSSLRRGCVHPIHLPQWGGPVSSYLLGVPQMGVQILGSPRDKWQFFPDSVNSIFSCSTLQKSSMSYSLNKHSFQPTRTPGRVLGAGR